MLACTIMVLTNALGSAFVEELECIEITATIDTHVHVVHLSRGGGHLGSWVREGGSVSAILVQEALAQELVVLHLHGFTHQGEGSIRNFTVLHEWHGLAGKHIECIVVHGTIGRVGPAQNAQVVLILLFGADRKLS